MLWLILAMFYKIAGEAIRKCIALRTAKSASLCADCYFAHMQHGANGRMAISCIFGGGMRRVKLDVLYCTDYRARNLPMRAGVIGFVYKIAPVE